MEVIRVTSYHRRDFDLAVARINPHDHSQVRSSLLRIIRATTSTLGNLQSLPLEIVYEICYLLDIRSLFNFRHVNRRAQQIVRGTRGYESAITHALETLCVITRTGIASWFTLPDLFEAPPTTSALALSLLTSLGGIIGYTRTGSIPSIAAGVSVGLVYLLSFLRLRAGQSYGEELGLLASAVLGGSSIPRVIKTGGKPIPVVLSVLATYGLFVFGFAFKEKRA
ncbi:hypothetical protein E8E15_004270 [Penicillium rubens]|nr:hypothetical protein E8E15_004270 [Penicillium rubens]